MNNDDELLALMALKNIPRVGLITAKQLVEKAGSAHTLFSRREELRDLIPDIHPALIHALDCPYAFKRAEQELQFARKNNIECIGYNDTRYPSRLRECDDAPVLLFYQGNANLNALRIISIVGTRRCTQYGRQLCEEFMRDMSTLSPHTLVVSGLAYGIDVEAHRQSLRNGMATVGVLAHGLDRIYPSVHRHTAAEMTQNGGLLTEYMSQTEPDRPNFVQRNRIVAGMSDATIVIESASKGGSLITARLAGSYNRECFAFPGRTIDKDSAGCNHLIRNDEAHLITCAADFVQAMGWDASPAAKVEAIQRQLFVDLTDEESRVVDILKETDHNIQINELVVTADIPINRLSAILFELEMKGVVKALAGGSYRLIG